MFAAADKHHVRDAQEKLIKYGKGEKTTTGLSYEDYVAAYREAKSLMSPEQIESLREGGAPEIKLYLDFVHTPLESWLQDEDCEDDPAVKRAFVKRMEYAYKRFWPAYVEKKAIGEGNFSRGPKLTLFVRALRKKVEQEPSLEMWRQARDEYQAMKEKTEEMILSEDIFEHLDDYELRLNYLNQKIRSDFREKFDKCKTDADMKPAIEDYRRIFKIK